jgi:hypothetical protein
MSASSMSFQGRMARENLAALIDAVGTTSPLSPRSLMGAAALSTPNVSAAVSEAVKVLAAPRTNLTLRTWSGDEVSTEATVLFPGLPAGGHGVTMTPIDSDYQVAGYVDAEALLRLLGPMLPQQRRAPAPPFVAQLDCPTMAVFAGFLDLVSAQVLARRTARVRDGLAMPSNVLGDAQPVATAYLQAYLANHWGRSSFRQSITYVLPLSVMPRAPAPDTTLAALRALGEAGLLVEKRKDRWLPTSAIEHVVAALMGASAGFQWQRVSRYPEDSLLIVERLYLFGGGGVVFEFRQIAEGVLRLSLCTRREIVEFVTDELSAIELPPLQAPVAEVPKFCGQCGTPLQPGWKFCGSCGAPLAGAAA